MNRLYALTPVFVDMMPVVKTHGLLYISKAHGIAIHLCCCGCGVETVTDLKPFWKSGWDFTDNAGKITLRPSIGNFAGEPNYHAHYYITENKIEWL